MASRTASRPRASVLRRQDARARSAGPGRRGCRRPRPPRGLGVRRVEGGHGGVAPRRQAFRQTKPTPCNPCAPCRPRRPGPVGQRCRTSRRTARRCAPRRSMPLAATVSRTVSAAHRGRGRLDGRRLVPGQEPGSGATTGHDQDDRDREQAAATSTQQPGQRTIPPSESAGPGRARPARNSSAGLWRRWVRTQEEPVRPGAPQTASHRDRSASIGVTAAQRRGSGSPAGCRAAGDRSVRTGRRCPACRGRPDRRGVRHGPRRSRRVHSRPGPKPWASRLVLTACRLVLSPRRRTPAPGRPRPR